MEKFNEFRAIYEEIDRHRRSAWLVAQRVWSSVVLQGYNSHDAGILRATPDDIILGAKACAQDVYDRIPNEPLSPSPQLLFEYRRKLEQENPYRFVLGAHRWLREGRWEDFTLKVRKKLANDYDARKARYLKKVVVDVS